MPVICSVCTAVQSPMIASGLTALHRSRCLYDHPTPCEHPGKSTQTPYRVRPDDLDSGFSERRPSPVSRFVGWAVELDVFPCHFLNVVAIGAAYLYLPRKSHLHSRIPAQAMHGPATKLTNRYWRAAERRGRTVAKPDRFPAYVTRQPRNNAYHFGDDDGRITCTYWAASSAQDSTVSNWCSCSRSSTVATAGRCLARLCMYSAHFRAPVLIDEIGAVVDCIG